jgi:hypothetical protein
MSKSLKVSLQKLLGSRAHYSYLSDVVFPELEQLVADNIIVPQELRKIRENVESKGVGILNPEVSFRSDITRNTYEADGWIAETVNELAPGVNVSHIIKKCSSKEDFKRSVRTYRSLESALKDTPYQGKIPKHFYAIKSKKIIDAPFVKGKILSRELDESSQEDKEAYLKGCIADYIDFYKFLNQPEVSQKLDLGQLSDFNEFFFFKYSKSGPLFQLYQRDIGNDLNTVGKKVIQGDLVPTNVLHGAENASDFSYVDWGNAVNNGFLEFDIGYLLKKSKVTPEVEEKLARYAAELAYDTSEDRERSFKIYTKNMITQELLSARRYVDRSKSKDIIDSDQRVSLENMALVNYNRAVARTRTAVNRGIVSQEFLNALVDQPIDGLKVVENYDHLLKDWDPDGSMSQDNLVPKDITKAEQYDPKKNLKAIKKSIFRERSRSLTYSALKIFAVVSALSMAGGIIYNQNRETEMLKEDAEKTRISYLQDNTTNLYESLFRRQFDLVSRRFAEGYKQLSFRENDTRIDSVAKKYQLDPQLIRNIMKVNRVYAGYTTLASDQTLDVEGISVADCISMADSINETRRMSTFYLRDNEVESLDPVKNLEACAQRLSKYFKEEKEKTPLESVGSYEIYVTELNKRVLTRFFFPFTEKKELNVGEKSYHMPYGDFSELEMKDIRDRVVRQLVYNAMYGISHGAEFGHLYSSSLKTPPDNF